MHVYIYIYDLYISPMLIIKVTQLSYKLNIIVYQLIIEHN